MRIKRFAVRLIVMLAVLTAAGAALFYSDWFQKRYVYPFPYRDLIEQHARNNGISPFLVAAVIRTESKFTPAARSPKGASGLMQMMPDTAKWVASQLDDELSLENLNDPDTNIRLGTWYIASLKHEFQDNQVLTLAAYNAGRGNVKNWMRQYGWDYSFQDSARIPYWETRRYVEKVLQDERRYRELYGK